MSGSVCEVSIVVAVYNREMLLERCLDSLVFQNFDRPYEILLVDDQSSDGSWKVMSDWQRRFPEKIRIFRNPTKGVSEAKNLGVSNACGRYVAFVDSDDYLTYGALTRLYGPIEDEPDPPEIVVSPIWRITGGRKTVLGGFSQQNPGKGEILSGNFFFLPGKLFRRDLFDRFGKLPKLGISEDVAWVFPAISNVEHVSYVRFPTYYYEFSDNSISLSNETKELADDAMTATGLILERTNPKWRAQAVRYVTHRAVNYLTKKFPRYQAEILAGIRDIYPEIRALSENGVLDKSLLSAAQQALVDSEFPRESLPLTVFRDDDLADYGEQMPLVVQNALANGDMDFVRGWRAVRMLFDRGGVYFHSDTEITGSIQVLSSYETVLAYDSTEAVYSEKVFACRKNSRIMKAVLDSYDTESTTSGAYSLADRLRMVAVGMSNAPNSSIRFTDVRMGLGVFPVETFIANPCNVADVPVISYDKTRSNLDRGLIEVSIAQDTLRRRIIKDNERIGRLQAEANRLKKQLETVTAPLKREISKLRTGVARANAEIKGLKTSEAYRFGMLMTWPARKLFKLFC